MGQGTDITSDWNVQGTDITSERNVQGTDITSERNVQGTDSYTSIYRLISTFPFIYILFMCTHVL